MELPSEKQSIERIDNNHVEAAVRIGCDPCATYRLPMRLVPDGSGNGLARLADQRNRKVAKI